MGDKSWLSDAVEVEDDAAAVDAPGAAAVSVSALAIECNAL